MAKLNYILCIGYLEEETHFHLAVWMRNKYSWTGKKLRYSTIAKTDSLITDSQVLFYKGLWRKVLKNYCNVPVLIEEILF